IFLSLNPYSNDCTRYEILKQRSLLVRISLCQPLVLELIAKSDINLSGNMKLPQNAHKNQPTKLHVSFISVNRVCHVLKREKYHPFKLIHVHELNEVISLDKLSCRMVAYVDMLKLVIEEEIRAIPLNMYHNTMNDFPKPCQLCLDLIMCANTLLYLHSIFV
ncbi:hypothetical protein L9F63_015754, partial [Diploptera punctata]